MTNHLFTPWLIANRRFRVYIPFHCALSHFLHTGFLCTIFRGPECALGWTSQGDMNIAHRWGLPCAYHVSPSCSPTYDDETVPCSVDQLWTFQKEMLSVLPRVGGFQRAWLCRENAIAANVNLPCLNLSLEGLDSLTWSSKAIVLSMCSLCNHFLDAYLRVERRGNHHTQISTTGLFVVL